jgi:Zn-dependent protease with chaperone function
MDLTAYRAIEANRWRSRLATSDAPRARGFTEDGERLAASLWIVRPKALAGGWVSRLLDAHPSTEDRVRRLERMS